MYRRRTPELRLNTSTENGSSSRMEKQSPPSPSRTKSHGLLSSPSGQRALLILGGLVSLFVVTKVFFPSESSPFALSHPPIATPLVAKNYLNSSKIEPAPFEFCPFYGPGDTLAQKYGAHNLAKSKVHMGSGGRIQRVIHKALSGLPVTISVLGGSSKSYCGSHLGAQELTLLCSFGVSWCRGQPDLPKVLPSSLFQLVEQRFPSSSLRAYQWSHASDRLGLFLLLQWTPLA